MHSVRGIPTVAAALGLLLVLATLAWAAPVLSIDPGPPNPTNDATPQFGFTVDETATAVECSIVADEATPVYGQCSGPASHEPDSPLDDGDYVFWVRATDGVEETERSRAFTVDTQPPSLTIDTGPSDPTNDRTPTFTFTTDAPSVECSIDQGTEAYGSCTSSGSHTSAALADGSYTFRVRATDAAGNEQVRTRSFSVDATPPSVSIDSGPAGPTSDRTPEFAFTADGTAAAVECSIDQGTPAYGSCSEPARHAPAAPLSDGAYTFRLRASDAAGNEQVRTRSFSVDGAAPSLSIDSGPEGPTNDSLPSFAFTAEPGASVACSLTRELAAPAYGPCTSLTTYAIATALPDGRYTFRVQATDGVGNHAIEFRTFTVDTAPPSLAISFGPSGTTTDSTPLFQFTAETDATMQCSIDQGTPAYGSCTGTGAHAAVAPLADGAYVFRVQATDAAGNQRTVTRAFTVDTVPDAPAPDPRTDPTPPSSSPQLLSPFPLVRISGTLTSTGARIRLLSVRAPRGALVRVAVRPACGARRPSRRCRVLRAAVTVGRRGVVAFRSVERAYRSGTVIVVRVWRDDRIGKYTRFTIVRGKAPRRVDQCLLPGAASGSRCPSA